MQRILISDDHSMLAMMFKIWFQQTGLDATVVAMPSTGKATLQAVREHRPDIIFQDMMLRDMPGSEIIGAVRKEFPDMRIFAMSAKPSLAKMALEVGADGSMLKEDHPNVIREALDWDITRGKWVSPLLQSKMLMAVAEMRKYDFTPGEINALSLAELSNVEIASILNLSDGTVRNIFTILYNKTGIRIRSELAQWAQNTLLLGEVHDD